MNTTISKPSFPVSQMAEDLVGSEIIKLSGEIKRKIKEGAPILNLTIGDFDPSIFPIPSELESYIVTAYNQGHTNYPMSNGVLKLRQAVSRFLHKRQSIDFSEDQILIAGGARPLIYAAYRVLVNPGEKVIFPVPSWNNNHYAHLVDADKILIETGPSQNFMPVNENIQPHLQDAALVALCSPLNPTGTVFSKSQLKEICDAILNENKKRGSKKPVYLLYDQIYAQLTFNNTEHTHPLEVCPDIAPYTVYVDGISKVFAATGVRVGWSFGPEFIINKMKSVLGHVGAWSPKAEQVASARFLDNDAAVDTFLSDMKKAVSDRLHALYEGFEKLKNLGFPLKAIAPQAAIYLTVQFALKGFTTPEGKLIESTAEITSFLLNEANLGIVPFSAFGASAESDWYRISVGTLRMDDIPQIFARLEAALSKLN